MLKMIYPYRIVPIDPSTPIAWSGRPEYDTVCDANDALRGAGKINQLRAEFVLSGELTDTQWADLLIRESYEYSGFAIRGLRPDRHHQIPSYTVPLARDGWTRAGYMMARYRTPLTVPSDCPYPQDIKLGYGDGLCDPPVIRSHNLAWGFYGTWCTNYVHQYDTDEWTPLIGKVPPPSFAWARMVNRYRHAHPNLDDRSVRDLLDRPTGRHICDAVMNRLGSHGTSWQHAIDRYITNTDRPPISPPNSLPLAG